MTTFRFDIHSGNRIQVKHTPAEDGSTATIMDFNDEEPLLQFCRELGFIQGRDYRLSVDEGRVLGRALLITMNDSDAMVFKLAHQGPHNLIVDGGSEPEV